MPQDPTRTSMKPPTTQVSSGDREQPQAGNPRGRSPDAMHPDTDPASRGSDAPDQEIAGDSLEPRTKPKHRFADVPAGPKEEE